ncbi:hypothetical protein MPLDJ20_60381 [Mesorhizobium plurifarium]|uniref:Uncharacterized protein n=1 Tax=Mesorhizobium plurifarium TaxID=69974 RepID=A0A090FIN3_MESPL|nr:hypothetical protein MPLDJ20_60381 [Mesorhizobium plurifarium]
MSVWVLTQCHWHLMTVTECYLG